MGIISGSFSEFSNCVDSEGIDSIFKLFSYFSMKSRDSFSCRIYEFSPIFSRYPKSSTAFK